jgi:glycogen synthase
VSGGGRVRVLFWCELFWPHLGGIEVLAAQYVPAMRARGLDLTVVTSHDDSIDLPDLGDHGGVPVYRLPFRAVLAARDVTAMLALRQQVRALYRELHPDLVHVFALGPSALFQIQTHAVCAAPVLVTLHGEALRGGADRGDTVLEKTLASATWIVCVSDAVWRATRGFAADLALRSSVIYSGVPLPHGSRTRRADAAPTLLCVGRLVRDKGFDRAIAAFATVAGRFPEARLVIAGDGPERADLERQAAAAGLAERVTFTGWLAPADVPELVQAATVVVMPSRREGLPLTAVQAAQVGTPVVGTDVGGLPEVVVDRITGLLVPAEDVTALADAIAFLLTHPAAAAQMGIEGRRRADAVFSWDRYLDAHETLYRRLIDRGTGDAG